MNPMRWVHRVWTLPTILFVMACGQIEEPLQPVTDTPQEGESISIAGKQGELAIEMPVTFEGNILQIAQLSRTDDFLALIYGEPASVTKFVYGPEVVVGYVLEFADPFEASARQDQAEERTVGDGVLPFGDSTLRNYSARYFYEEDLSNIFVKMRNQILTLRVDPGTDAQSVGLRRGSDLATEIFRLNGLLGTFPVNQLDLLAPLASNPNPEFVTPSMLADAKILSLSPLPYDRLDLSTNQAISVALSYNVFATDTLGIHLRPYVVGSGDNWTYARDQAVELRVEKLVTGMGEIEIPLQIPARTISGEAEVWIDMVFTTDNVSRGSSAFLKYAGSVP